MTRKVGYARVSTEGQNLGRQLAALHQEGCDPIFQDKASGKSVRGRPGLDKAIKALRPGDVLVLAEWDRATRSMLDGIAIMERVRERGARLTGSSSTCRRPSARASWPSYRPWLRTSASAS